MPGPEASRLERTDQAEFLTAGAELRSERSRRVDGVAEQLRRDGRLGFDIRHRLHPAEMFHVKHPPQPRVITVWRSRPSPSDSEWKPRSPTRSCTSLRS